MTAFAPESPDAARTGGTVESAREESRTGPRSLLSDFFESPDRSNMRRGHRPFVGFAKMLLVALATGLIVALFIWPQVRKNDNTFKIGAAENLDIEQEDVESLRVVKARLTGTGAEGRPYTLTFESASQTNRDSDLVILAGPNADVYLRDGSWVALSAPNGRYHRAGRILELDGPVDVFHDSGLEFRTGSITFNLGTGAGAGHDPLRGQGPFGQVESEGFRLREMGAVFQFTGKTRVVLFSAPGLAG